MMAKLHDPFFGEWDPAEHDSPREQALSDCLDVAEARIAQLEAAARAVTECEDDLEDAVLALRAVLEAGAAT